jgi:putative ABC transport system permease protein
MSLWSRLVNVVRGDRLIRDIDEELESHIADAIADGRDPAEARRAFGAPLRQREASRDIRRVVWLGDWLMDLRYAVRTLRRQPGFLIAAVLSLALGIGANTAIFSLIDAVLLRALPVSEPDRLVQLTRIYANGHTGTSFSWPLFQYLQESTHTFSGMFAQANDVSRIDIDLQGTAERVTAAMVSGTYYPVLGLTPGAGRLLSAEDDGPGAAAAAVISDQYWQRRFARDPSAIGRVFRLNNVPVTIVGVTPPEFFGTLPGTSPDMTLPLSMMASTGGYEAWRESDGFNFLSVMARLEPGTPSAQAAADARAVFLGRMQALAGQTRNESARRRLLQQRVDLAPARNGFNSLREEFSRPLLILMVIVGLVLLLACVNLSALLFARAAARRREIIVRCAIGAGRGRLIRQLLTESLVLATLGSAAGIVLAIWFSSALVTMMANGGTLILPRTPDWRLLIFAVGITLATSLLVGLVPSLHAARVDLRLGAQSTRSSTRRRLGDALVIGQIAISLVLVVGATLFVGTLIKLYSTNAGFRPQGVLTFRLDTKEKPDNPHRLAVESDLLQQIERMPGVEAASAARILFISGGGWNGPVRVEGRTPAPNNDEALVDFNAVGPGFFETTGTPIVAGRDFDARDAQSGRVAIVNQSFAKSYFPDRSPLGRHMSIAGEADQYEIVGVAGDAKYLDLKEAFPPTAYVALGQKRQNATTLLVHTVGGNPLSIVPEVEALLHNIDPAMRLGRVSTFQEHIDQSILTERIMATLGAFFGVLALIVACLGIFGVMAFQVAQRTREFGVRMALGATRRRVTTLVLRDVCVIVIVGSAIGTAAAAGLARVIKAFLFGVETTDPGVFLFAIALLAVASLSAGYIPARRAARVDPMVALRHE